MKALKPLCFAGTTYFKQFFVNLSVVILKVSTADITDLLSLKQQSMFNQSS